ncbi:XdhC family protein [Ectobacillus ponti]|uniref:XdhC family protein n=1 Tax=Ectobacillus ponti TaxID=2961894 RepID=A0AA42BUH0_9BACI|nr:XdhC family protein [Ectobacillus ponti]MCP8970528.1 XdhC family protein [Ectobacillus ponti]
MNTVQDIWEAAVARDEPCVMATLVGTEGSSYRKSGAVMVFWEDGTRQGMLSAGCIEEDLACRANELGSGDWLLCEYDTYDDTDVSWAVGCAGKMQILLESLDHSALEQLQCAVAQLHQGYQVRVTKSLEEQCTGFFSENGHIWGAAAPGASIYTQTIAPKPRLVVFGAGEDAVPLVQFASRAGFSVIVCDWREAWCNPVRFPEAKQYFVGLPQEVVPELSLTERDFVVVMTHHFQRDRELLELLQEQNLQYLGVLGSRKRTARLLREFAPDWLSAPVGLPIGAEGPEEIAISIVAEMIAVLRGKRDEYCRGVFGCRMQQKNGAGHS